MIGKLTGVVADIFEENMILDVGGVGYQIYCTTPTLTQLRSATNTLFTFFIETHVREDHIHLFGFTTLEQRQSFNLLQTVAGIGARVALAILGALTPEQLQQAIAQKDKAMLSTAPGVGPKLAERMLIELKGKIFSCQPVSLKSNALKAQDETDDAILALCNLGITRNDAVNAVTQILKNQPDASIDQLIRLALQMRASQ